MTETLEQILNFDDNDLAANRLGQLTQKQKDLLADMAKKHKGFNIGIGIFIAVMVGGSLLTALGAPLLATLGGSLLSKGTITPEAILTLLPAICMGLFFVVVFGGIMLLVLRVVFERANRKVDTAVRRAEGKVNFVWVERRERHTSGKSSSYRTVRSLEMRVGTENTFNNVNGQLPSLMNQGEEWIIYYTNHPFKFLAAEKMK